MDTQIQPPHVARRGGFTLLELSVVLVVVGLVMGAILGARRVIHLSEMRATLDDARTYAVAVQQFKDKYGELPGDFSRATKVWGFAGVSASCLSNAGVTVTSSATEATCDGNGDGRWDVTASEDLFAWKHLVNAGFVKGNYTGISAVGVTPYRMVGATTNVPAAKITEGAGWSFGYADQTNSNFGGANYWGTQSIGNVLFLGGAGASAMNAAQMKAEDAALLDAKADDGFPSTGSILAEGGAGSACVPAVVGSAVPVYSANTGSLCALRFMLNRVNAASAL